MWSVEGGAWDIVYVKKTKHACMGRVQAFRTPWSRRRCPARRGCVCSREKLTMLRWYFIQCIKPTSPDIAPSSKANAGEKAKQQSIENQQRLYLKLEIDIAPSSKNNARGKSKTTNYRESAETVS